MKHSLETAVSAGKISELDACCGLDGLDLAALVTDYGTSEVLVRLRSGDGDGRLVCSVRDALYGTTFTANGQTFTRSQIRDITAVGTVRPPCDYRDDVPGVCAYCALDHASLLAAYTIGAVR